MYLWAIGEALVPEAAAIGCGGHSDNSAEDRAEIALVAESHLLADACHRVIGVRKQRLCSLYPVVVEIFHEQQTGDPLEEAHEIRLTHPTDAGSSLYLDTAPAILCQISEEGTKPVQSTLLALKGIYSPCIGGILVYQQDEKHPQVRLQGK